MTRTSSFRTNPFSGVGGWERKCSKLASPKLSAKRALAIDLSAMDLLASRAPIILICSCVWDYLTIYNPLYGECVRKEILHLHRRYSPAPRFGATDRRQPSSASFRRELNCGCVSDLRAALRDPLLRNRGRARAKFLMIQVRGLVPLKITSTIYNCPSICLLGLLLGCVA